MQHQNQTSAPTAGASSHGQRRERAHTEIAASSSLSCVRVPGMHPISLAPQAATALRTPDARNRLFSSAHPCAWERATTADCA
jgi:hypothetical protein